MGTVADKLSRNEQDILTRKLQELEAIERELQRRDNMQNPMHYGLPDLLFPQGQKQGTLSPVTGEIEREPLDEPESDDAYRARQNYAIKRFIEDQLHFRKDGRVIHIFFVDQQIQFISDMFYGRITKSILWKGRGCGGSLCAAILIWLCLIYRNMSFIDLGGSMEQSRIVYEYVSEFWDCFPDMKAGLLEGKPLLTNTRLVTGVQLKCIPASEKMARGKHLPGLIADEACQNDPNSDITFRAAMQGCMSEPDHMIVLLSTFHVPVGLFQEVWDNAEAKGFSRYRWDCFDVMKKCSEGLQYATKEDPDAIKFCEDQCPLTIKEALYDENDELAGYRYSGCHGRCRHTDGFLPRENVITALTMNEGTEIFHIEYACNRPRFSGPIYGLEAIEEAALEEFTIDDNQRTIVGIDWGVTEGVLILGKDSIENGPQVIASKYLSVKLISEYIRILNDWQEEYGNLQVYADSSHPFEIGDLEEAGFDVVPVDFSTMKDYGISNLTKMFLYNKIQMLDDNERLINQLKGYRKDPKTGKPLKKDDHGPDALLCLSVSIDFGERWGHLITARARGHSKGRFDKAVEKARKADGGEVEEKEIDTENGVMLF